jgi:hypothetical protein
LFVALFILLFQVVIDRANRLLYQENDKIKTFHSGLLLSTVIREREAQKDLMKLKKQQLKLMDDNYVEQERSILAEQLLEEQKEQQLRILRSKQLASSQLEQLNHYRLRQTLERQEQLSDGDRLKKLAADSLIDSEFEEHQRHERMRELNMEYTRANKEQELVKHEKKIQELAEAQKIAKFAAEKERLQQLRKEHENAKFIIKQTRHEKMLRRQYEHLESNKQN